MFNNVMKVLHVEPRRKSPLDEFVQEVAKEAHINRRKALNAILSYAGNLNHYLSKSPEIKKVRIVGRRAVLIESREDRLIPGKRMTKEDYVRAIAREADMNLDKAEIALNTIEGTINKILDEELKVKGIGEVIIKPIGTYLYRPKDQAEYFIPPTQIVID